MGLLKQKRYVGIEEFCQEYYDGLFHTTIGEEDARKLWLDNVFASFVEADKSLEVIDRNLFYQEIDALHLELFALAWTHRFKNAIYTIPQSIFTRHYLEENGKINTWEAMQRYNLTVAQTATMTANGQHMTGDTSAERFIINRVNNKRLEFMTKWSDANIEDLSNVSEKEHNLINCVARVSNRIDADIEKNKQLGNRRLTALLLFRLGWEEVKDLSNKALFKLAAYTLSTYKAEMDILKGISLRV